MRLAIVADGGDHGPLGADDHVRLETQISTRWTMCFTSAGVASFFMTTITERFLAEKGVGFFGAASGLLKKGTGSEQPRGILLVVTSLRSACPLFQQLVINRWRSIGGRFWQRKTPREPVIRISGRYVLSLGSRLNTSTGPATQRAKAKKAPIPTWSRGHVTHKHDFGMDRGHLQAESPGGGGLVRIPRTARGACLPRSRHAPACRWHHE